MRTPRSLATLTIAAAVSLTAGCVIQLPTQTATAGQGIGETVVPTTSASAAPFEQAPSESADAGAALVDTEWAGNVDFPSSDELTLRWLFEADGTLMIYDWADDADVNFDSAADTWEVVDGQLHIYLSNIEEIEGLTFEGPAPADAALTLDGTDDKGASGYVLSMARQ